jgi:hypothetical protein
MTPSEAPKALQASECSELLDPTRANCWISAQHQPGKFIEIFGEPQDQVLLQLAAAPCLIRPLCLQITQQECINRERPRTAAFLIALTCSAHWAEAHVKIARMTLTIKLDRNWSSFQLANSAPPLSVTDSAIAPSARILLQVGFCFTAAREERQRATAITGATECLQIEGTEHKEAAEMTAAASVERAASTDRGQPTRRGAERKAKEKKQEHNKYQSHKERQASKARKANE